MENKKENIKDQKKKKPDMNELAFNIVMVATEEKDVPDKTEKDK